MREHCAAGAAALLLLFDVHLTDDAQRTRLVAEGWGRAAGRVVGSELAPWNRMPRSATMRG